MDHQTAVAENRAALQATIDFGIRKLKAPKWEPTPGSEAAAELVNTETRADGSPWGEEQPRTAYATANLMMTGVLDNLSALRQLLDDQMTVIGATVVARSAIEIASGVWWLMEPGIGVRVRMCRELALSLGSARRAGQLAKEFRDTGFDVSDAIQEAEQQEARVLQRIAALGVGTPTSGYSPKIGNQEAPDATHGTAAMLKAVMPASIPGTAIYRTYSAVTHGEIYGLMNFMTPEISADGTTLLRWHLPPDVLDSTIQMAIMAFREPWKRISKVMGWGKLEDDLWEIKLSKIYTAPAQARRLRHRLGGPAGRSRRAEGPCRGGPSRGRQAWARSPPPRHGRQTRGAGKGRAPRGSVSPDRPPAGRCRRACPSGRTATRR
jgi:hypothetical protein